MAEIGGNNSTVSSRHTRSELIRESCALHGVDFITPLYTLFWKCCFHYYFQFVISTTVAVYLLSALLMVFFLLFHWHVSRFQHATLAMMDLIALFFLERNAKVKQQNSGDSIFIVK